MRHHRNVKGAPPAAAKGKGRRKAAGRPPRRRPPGSERPRAKAEFSRRKVSDATVMHLDRPDCWACGKRPYVDEDEAELAIRCGKGRSAYVCPGNPDVWHLTTQKA